MQEKVATYLEEQERKRLEKQQIAREKILMELGLQEKVYQPEGEPDDYRKYPCMEPDGRRFRYVPVSVTEEEWEAIQRSRAEDDLGKRWKNPVSKLLGTAARVFFIGGIVLGILMFLYVWISGNLLTGIMAAVDICAPAAMCWLVLLTLAEIIRLLDKP